MKSMLLLSLLAVSLQAAPAGHRDQAVSDNESSTDVASAPSAQPATEPIVSTASDQPASTPAADESYTDACGVSTPTTPVAPTVPTAPTTSVAPVVSACPVMACINDYLPPFGCGLLSGAALACVETEVVNPIVCYLLAGYGDVFKLAAEVGIFGSAAYFAYVNRNQDQDEGDDEDEQEYAASAQCKCMQPARLVGVLAGVLAWYNFHG